MTSQAASGQNGPLAGEFEEQIPDEAGKLKQIYSFRSSFINLKKRVFNVLIVDDVAYNVTATEYILKSVIPCRCEFAYNGLDAVEIIRNSKQ